MCNITLFNLILFFTVVLKIIQNFQYSWFPNGLIIDLDDKLTVAYRLFTFVMVTMYIEVIGFGVYASCKLISQGFMFGSIKKK